MSEYVSGMRVAQEADIDGRHIQLLELDFQRGIYLMGPNDGHYALVMAGDGHFGEAYRQARKRGGFGIRLPEEPDLGKPQV